MLVHIRPTVGLIAIAVSLMVASPVRSQVKVSPIDSFQGFAGLFNLAQGTVRIVALVSPTCPECVADIEAVHEMMDEIDAPRLRAFFVFVPMSEGDDNAAAETLVTKLHGRRSVYLWDPKNITGEAWKQLVGLSTPARDVYFIYDSDARFTDEPSDPDFWMHQHKQIDGPVLDARELGEHARELLKRLEQRQKAQQAPAADQ